MKDRNETRAMLLEVAGTTFAEFGYRETSTREITRRAGMNMAAIHYYFAEKEIIYVEALRLAFDKTFADLGNQIDPQASVPEKLHQFIRFLISRMADRESSWYGKIIMREFIEQNQPQLTRELLFPLEDVFNQILQAFLEIRPTEETLHLCKMSVFTLCAFSHIASLLLHQDLSQADPQKLSQHIYQFALGGLAAIKLEMRHAAMGDKKGKKAT